jgi:hypothetical protein
MTSLFSGINWAATIAGHLFTLVETEGARRGKMTPTALGAARRREWDQHKDGVIFASSPNKDFFKGKMARGLSPINSPPAFMTAYLTGGFDAPPTTGSFAFDVCCSILEWGNKDNEGMNRSWFWCRSLKIPNNDPMFGQFVFWSWPDRLTASAISEGMAEAMISYIRQSIDKGKIDQTSSKMYGLLTSWGYDMTKAGSGNLIQGLYTFPGAYTHSSLSDTQKVALREDHDMIIKILDNAKKANSNLPKDQKKPASEPGGLVFKFFVK